ncbi:MAG: hypothetical protein QF747_01530 [Patescibacteria group bacterium]|jgi:hypothetical protein|nr:hypothetical protein [Patescibacteria group bacterium]
MDSPTLYRDILKRAWSVTKNHTHLWVLGFLAALLGNGGEFEFILTQFNKLSSGTITFGQGVLTTLGTGGSNIVQYAVGLLVKSGENHAMFAVFSVILIVSIWLVVSSQGALIRAIAASSANSGIGSLKGHFLAGNSSFWHLLSILVFTRLGAFFILGVIGLPLFVILMYWIDPIKSLFLVIFVLGLPLFIIASLISKYAVAFRMLENKKWKQSITSALSLFFDHWLVSIELALILFLVNIIVGAVILVVVLIFAVPFILLSYFIQSAVSGIFLWIGQVLAFLLLLLLGSILATFQYASWTELFLKIRKGKHLSKILRTITHFREIYR